MLSEFLAFIKTNELVKPEDRILLAVSGGIDSVVMAHLFSQATFDFGIAHCNFQLRGADADRDEAFVEQFAGILKVPFFTKRFDTKKYAKDRGLSTQLAARDLRYNWFEQVVQENNYALIATAHHLNDSIETVLFNLVKGTGIAGLTGIPIKNKSIIRPLSFASREAIEKYAAAHNLTWREDATNKESDYSRNLIRNKVLPLLKEINPSLEHTFEATLSRLQSTSRLVEAQVTLIKNAHMEVRGEDVYIDKSALKNIEITVLSELLKPYGYNYSQSLSIRNALNEVGKIFDSNDYVLNVDRSQLIISRVRANETKKEEILAGQEYYDNEEFTLQLETTSGNSIRKDVDAGFDFEKLNFPLVVRKWQAGDSFRPLGMKGEKKLSDFMIDNKIPLNLKDRVHVLISGNDIAWVIGHRIDDRFKITDSTKTTLNIRLESK